jgi:DNA-binding transcriptional ArsR family regulator
MDGSLKKDDLFHLLQNERRRRVLKYLSDTEGAVEMRAIAEQIAAWEQETTVQQLSSQERQRVYIALYQTHLPKLAEAGIITYNQSRGIVEETPLTDQVIQYLDRDDATNRAADTNSKWVIYYTVVTAISVLLISVVWSGFELFPILSDVGLALFITLLYSTVTFMRAVDKKQISLPEPLAGIQTNKD